MYLPSAEPHLKKMCSVWGFFSHSRVLSRILASVLSLLVVFSPIVARVLSPVVARFLSPVVARVVSPVVARVGSCSD